MELVNSMSKREKSNSVKRRKFRKKSEKELEKEAMMEENFSVLGIVTVLVICTIIGVVLGYLLYKIAIHSSDVAVIMDRILL